MKITQDVRKYAAEQGLAEEEALKQGMEEKSREFTKNGSELYAKASARKAKAVQPASAACALAVMASTAGWVSLRSALMA